MRRIGSHFLNCRTATTDASRLGLELKQDIGFLDARGPVRKEGKVVDEEGGRPFGARVQGPVENALRGAANVKGWSLPRSRTKSGNGWPLLLPGLVEDVVASRFLFSVLSRTHGYS